MSPTVKSALDRKIQNRLMNLWVFRETKTVLTYVSVPAEIDTSLFLETAIRLKKTVAVPRCEDQSGRMSFYIIRTASELSPGHFGVLEPAAHCEPLSDIPGDALCVVPALAFDRKGFRLGYGKGYYDRFLNRFTGTAVGLCYARCVQDALPHGKYDRAVQLLVTEKEIISAEIKENAIHG